MVTIRLQPAKLAEELKKHHADCKGIDSGTHAIIECVCADRGAIDANGNGHITQDEVVKHVQKTAPQKSRKEIISDIDTNDNGRITKKEVKVWIAKEDKNK